MKCEQISLDEIREKAPEAADAIDEMNTPDEVKMQTWEHQIIEVNRKENWVYTASGIRGEIKFRNYSYPLDEFEKFFKFKLENGFHSFTNIKMPKPINRKWTKP